MVAVGDSGSVYNFAPREFDGASKMESPLTIMIRYKLFLSSDWSTLALEPVEYFDLDPGEEPDLDSVPRLDRALAYLGLERSTVQFTVISLEKRRTGQTKVISESFWNGGRNSLAEVSESGLSTQLILENFLTEQPATWEILRSEKNDGLWQVTYHGIICQNPDGSQSESKVYPIECRPGIGDQPRSGSPLRACKIRRQTYGLMCPSCSAVLSSSPQDSGIVCHHCGQRIEFE